MGVIPEFTFGDRLRKARELTGLEQKDFAAEIGISRTSVSNAETGANRPHQITIKAWALRTGVNMDWLLGNGGPQGGDSVSDPSNRSYADRVLAVA